METQLRQCFARGKFEIANRVIAFCRRRIIGGRRETRGRECDKRNTKIRIVGFMLTISLPFGLDSFEQLGVGPFKVVGKFHFGF